MVQMNIFLLYVCMESIQLLQSQQHLRSGMLLALGISIKLLPIVLLPYLIYRKQFKASIYTLLFISAFMFLPALFVGWEMNKQLHNEWSQIIDPRKDVYLADQNKFGEGIHSLSGLFAAYLSPSKSMLDIDSPRLIAKSTPHQLSLLLNGSRALLILILFFIYFLRSRPFSFAKDTFHQYWELSYLLCIVPLIFPHQQKYAFVFMTPACFYFLNYLLSNWSKPIMTMTKRMLYLLGLSLFFILTTVTTDGIVGHHLNDLSEYYKSITFGCILLILLLSSATPMGRKHI
tara:strand:+ start:621 stop:1484 length:864 start_codon:yes stop_codon:yes gene_type:complete